MAGLLFINIYKKKSYSNKIKLILVSLQFSWIKNKKLRRYTKNWIFFSSKYFFFCVILQSQCTVIHLTVCKIELKWFSISKLLFTSLTRTGIGGISLLWHISVLGLPFISPKSIFYLRWRKSIEEEKFLKSTKLPYFFIRFMATHPNSRMEQQLPTISH
jgi:hypothetical protein